MKDVTPNLEKVIAIDFDGCLCTSNWPYVGEPNWNVIEAIKEEKRNGAHIILWTCREGDLLKDAVEACAYWGIELDGVNESLPQWIEKWGSATRKIGATEYWDDRAYNPLVTPFNQIPAYRQGYTKGMKRGLFL